ncbi:MAG: MerR family transcriptional regulator [Dehalococcoidia bacterium]
MPGQPAAEATQGRGQPTRWISLNRACNLLGVNESTLRRWADAGHVRSFRTPGGHRRFAEDDLRALMAGQTKTAAAGYGSLGNLALTRIRRRLQRDKRRQARWHSGVPESDREHLRSLGQRLVNLTSEYLGRTSRRSRLMEEARQIGHEYGAEFADKQLPVRDAVEAFIFFRKGLDDAAIELAHRGNLSGEEAVEVWDLVTGLADQVLLAMADAYEQARSRQATPTT